MSTSSRTLEPREGELALSLTVLWILLIVASLCFHSAVFSETGNGVELLPTRNDLVLVRVLRQLSLYSLEVELVDPVISNGELRGRNFVVNLSGVSAPPMLDSASDEERMVLSSKVAEYVHPRVVDREMYLELESSNFGEFVKLMSESGAISQVDGFLWFSVPSRFVENAMTEVSTVLFNYYLLRFGYASFRNEAEKVKYGPMLKLGEDYARDETLGLWERYRSVGFATPRSVDSVGSVAIRIVEVQYDGKNEYVRIRNDGETPVDLTGWTLESTVGGQRFVFPNITLRPKGVISIHSGPEAEGPIVWTRRYVWRNEGDEAVLKDRFGNEISRFVYPSK